MTVSPQPIVPPVAIKDIANTVLNTPTTFNALANDFDPNIPVAPLTLVSFTQTAHGAVVKNANNTFTYTPVCELSGRR